MSIQSSFRTTQPQLNINAAAEPAPVADGQVLATLKAVWAGKTLILATTLISLGLGQLWLSKGATPLYKATSSVLLAPQDERLTDPDPVPELQRPIDETIRRTEVEILRGRALLGTVVDDLGLVQDPEFNPTLREPGLKSQMKALIFGDTPTSVSPQRQRDIAVSLLGNSLSIRNLSPSLVFELSATTQSPQKSVAIADQLAKNYISQQVALKRRESDDAIRWLGQRVTDLQQQIESSNAELSKLSGSSNAEAPRVQVQTRRLQRLTEDLVHARAALAESERARQALPASASETERATRDAQVSIDAAALRNLERQYGAIEADLRNETEIATRQALLEQQNQTDLLVYSHFLTRLKDAVAREGRQLADSRILAQAVEPGQPYLPRPSLVLTLSIMLGVASGLLILFLRQALRQTIRSAQELEEITGQKVIGRLPRLPHGKGRSSINYLFDHPNSPAAEALRSLRTNILLEQLLLGQKVIAITSSNPQEGKTTISLALARQMASLGKKVLVIEGDLRRRVFRDYMECAGHYSILTALSGERPLSQVVTTDLRSGMDLLLGAKTPGNPADIFSSNAFADLLAEARDSYDYVLIDTPPVLCVPDSKIILQGCDRALFVVNWDVTTRTQLRDGMAALHMSGRKVGGVILNRIDQRKSRGSYYYSGYYDTKPARKFFRA